MAQDGGSSCSLPWKKNIFRDDVPSKNVYTNDDVPQETAPKSAGLHCPQCIFFETMFFTVVRGAKHHQAL
jgi:hypothetical protein